MGRKLSDLDVMNHQKNTKTQADQKADHTHGAEQSERFVIAKGPYNDLQSLIGVPEQIGSHPRFSMCPYSLHMHRDLQNLYVLKNQVDKCFLRQG